MFVAATTECFEDVTLDEALEKILELEFSSVEISLDENSRQLKPSDVARDLERAIGICPATQASSGEIKVPNTSRMPGRS